MLQLTVEMEAAAQLFGLASRSAAVRQVQARRLVRQIREFGISVTEPGECVIQCGDTLRARRRITVRFCLQGPIVRKFFARRVVLAVEVLIYVLLYLLVLTLLRSHLVRVLQQVLVFLLDQLLRRIPLLAHIFGQVRTTIFG